MMRLSVSFRAAGWRAAVTALLAEMRRQGWTGSLARPVGTRGRRVGWTWTAGPVQERVIRVGPWGMLARRAYDIEWDEWVYRLDADRKGA